MKHIKLFESYGYENISISRNDFYTFTDQRNPNHLTIVPFSRKDIMEIEKVLSTKELDGRISFRSPSRISEDITGIQFSIHKLTKHETPLMKISIGEFTRQCNIFKLDDEWFLYQNDLLVMKEDEEGIYTKCDQLEGLIQEINRTI